MKLTRTILRISELIHKKTIRTDHLQLTEGTSNEYGQSYSDIICHCPLKTDNPIAFYLLCPVCAAAAAAVFVFFFHSILFHCNINTKDQISIGTPIKFNEFPFACHNDAIYTREKVRIYDG